VLAAPGAEAAARAFDAPAGPITIVTSPEAPKL
jgi:hypothetical protein